VFCRDGPRRCLRSLLPQALIAGRFLGGVFGPGGLPGGRPGLSGWLSWSGAGGGQPARGSGGSGGGVLRKI